MLKKRSGWAWRLKCSHEDQTGQKACVDVVKLEMRATLKHERHDGVGASAGSTCSGDVHARLTSGGGLLQKAASHRAWLACLELFNGFTQFTLLRSLA